MPLYEYKAISANSQILTGEQSANSGDAVVKTLQAQGHMPVYVRERRSSIRLFKAHKQPAMSGKAMSFFFSELATLLEAGLALDHALSRVQRLAKKKKQILLIERLLTGLQQGESLAGLMLQESDTFNRFQISLIRAGEASGSLDQVMAELASYQETMQRLRQTVVTSLIYPTVLVVTTILSLLVMMVFVVPQFVPLFEGSEESLPWLTVAVFNVASVSHQYWWLPSTLFIVVALSVESFKNHRRQDFDAMVLRMPVLGGLLQTVNTARFSRTLSSLLRHDVSLHKAMILAEGVLTNSSMQRAVKHSTQQLEQGKKVSASLPTNLFPDLFMELLQVGEESGQIAPMLAKTAELYERELEAQTKRLLTLIEPVMIVGLGLIIGVIVIAIMLAMLGLNDLVV